MKRYYWDTAAGTPLDKRVFEAMLPYLSVNEGNPASLHQEGVIAEKAVNSARLQVAEILSAHPDEIVFTGSGTESVNLAILGLATTRNSGRQVITTAIEHKAVLEPCRHLQKKGLKVVYLPVDQVGQIDLKNLAESLTPQTFLVSVMMVNNEIGSLAPIKEIAKIIRYYRRKNNSLLPYFHTDACQAPRFYDLKVEKLGIDLLSFNGSKIYGPKGIGALYVRRGVPLSPIIYGGGQELSRRSGTLNVAGIVGLTEALTLCCRLREKESRKLAEIRNKLLVELKKISDLTINGCQTKDTINQERSPNNLNFSLTGFDSEQLVLELDAKGFAVSGGSACSHAFGENSSYVIKAISGDDRRATSALRISLGRDAKMVEVDKFILALRAIISKYKNFTNLH